MERGRDEFKVYLDLLDTLTALADKGFNESEIGFLYVNAVSHASSDALLSKLINETSYSIERDRKRKFQEEVKNYLNTIKNEIKFDGITKETILARCQNAELKNIVPGERGIETILHDILNGGASTEMYECIGKQVIAGAKKYLSEKPKHLRHPYKLFQEYNRIENSLLELTKKRGY